jgi:diguanylate cyclase (GGDEF)-like protein
MVLAAVTLAAISCTLAGALVIRDYENRNLELTANSIAYSVEPALVFGDLETAREGIQGAVDQRTVSRVLLVAPNDEKLSDLKFENSSWTAWLEPIANPLLGHTPAAAIVRYNGDALGTVYVYGSSTMLLGYLGLALIFTVLCLGLAAVTTRMLANRLQGDVVGPLEQIASIAYAVRHERKFSRRVPESGIEEIDQFSQNFNALIAELQERHNVIVLENQELCRKSTHDPLTGLGNRELFDTRLEIALADATVSEQKVAVAFLDADKFKPINDRLGHRAGDTVLQNIADCLRSVSSQGIQAFRIGGDEFALIFAFDAKSDFIKQSLARIDWLLAKGAKLECGEQVSISMSVGLATFPDNGCNSATLLNHADIQMYEHKKRRSCEIERQRIYA